MAVSTNYRSDLYDNANDHGVTPYGHVFLYRCIRCRSTNTIGLRQRPCDGQIRCAGKLDRLCQTISSPLRYAEVSIFAMKTTIFHPSLCLISNFFSPQIRANRMLCRKRHFIFRPFDMCIDHRYGIMYD